MNKNTEDLSLPDLVSESSKTLPSEGMILNNSDKLLLSRFASTSEDSHNLIANNNDIAVDLVVPSPQSPAATPVPNFDSPDDNEVPAVDGMENDRLISPLASDQNIFSNIQHQEEIEDIALALFTVLDLCLLRFSSTHNLPFVPFGIRSLIKAYTYAWVFDDHTIREAVSLWCADRDAALFLHGPIHNWQVCHVTNMQGLFAQQTQFNDNINLWDVSHVVTMDSMFASAVTFNQPLYAWQTHSVVDMSGMFYHAKSFNQPIHTWDVSQVKTMFAMFMHASAFNQPLEHWDVGNVEEMESMFRETRDFNQPLYTWNVANVTNMCGMFQHALAFNQPLTSWPVYNVVDMQSMFESAQSFDSDLSDWDMDSVEDVSRMFAYAIAFNQPLHSWYNMQQIVCMNQMFVDCWQFNQNLNGWAVAQVEMMHEMFAGATSFDPRNIADWQLKESIERESLFRFATIFDHS